MDLALYDNLPAKYNDRKVRLTSNKTDEQFEKPLGDVLGELQKSIIKEEKSWD